MLRTDLDSGPHAVVNTRNTAAVLRVDVIEVRQAGP